MAVLYKLYQEKRNVARKGKWYARAYHDKTVTINDLAKIMQDNCTLKRSDILAVISELAETMKTQLQNSARVKIDGFGSFKIGLQSTPADSAREFNPVKNIKGMHVLFQPEVKIDGKRKRTKSFLDGAKVSETGVYNVLKPKKKGGGTPAPGQ